MKIEALEKLSEKRAETRGTIKPYVNPVDRLLGSVEGLEEKLLSLEEVKN